MHSFCDFTSVSSMTRSNLKLSCGRLAVLCIATIVNISMGHMSIFKPSPHFMNTKIRKDKWISILNDEMFRDMQSYDDIRKNEKIMSIYPTLDALITGEKHRRFEEKLDPRCGRTIVGPPTDYTNISHSPVTHDGPFQVKCAGTVYKFYEKGNAELGGKEIVIELADCCSTETCLVELQWLGFRPGKRKGTKEIQAYAFCINFKHPSGGSLKKPHPNPASPPSPTPGAGNLPPSPKPKTDATPVSPSMPPTKPDKKSLKCRQKNRE